MTRLSKGCSFGCFTEREKVVELYQGCIERAKTKAESAIEASPSPGSICPRLSLLALSFFEDIVLGHIDASPGCEDLYKRIDTYCDSVMTGTSHITRMHPDVGQRRCLSAPPPVCSP